MATLHLDKSTARYQIRAYQSGKLYINDQCLTQSVIVTANELIHPWTPQTIAELHAGHFTEILTLRPTILLIGTGAQHVFLPVELYGELINAGIGIEMMDTAAACRTYNALIAEDRNVAAALIIK